MSDEPLSGIGIGERANVDESDDDTINDLLKEYEVNQLSDLSDDQIFELARRLDEKEELEGITQVPEEGERGSGILAQVARVKSRLAREDVFQEQLGELEQISNQTELLRRLSATLSSIDQTLKTNSDLLADLVESTARGESLSVKDTNRLTITASNRLRDVTDDTDITTSSIIVKASTQNSGSLFIGDQEVEVGSGFELEPGETQVFPVDVVSENFKLSAESVGDTYSYIALGLPT